MPRGPTGSPTPRVAAERADFDVPSRDGRLLRLRQAIQHFLPPSVDLFDHAQIDTAAANRRAGHGPFAQLVHGDFIVLGGVGSIDVGLAALAGGVDRIAHQHGRGAEVAAQPLLPLFLSRIAFPAGGHSRIEHAEQVPVMCQKRRNVNPVLGLPGDFARTVGEHGGQVVFRIAAAAKHARAVGDRRSDALGRGSL